MKYFSPARVYFEPRALEYPLGKKIHDYYMAKNIPLIVTPSHNRVTGIPGKTPQAGYRESKKTLVVGVKKSLTLDTCRPSADYEFTLGTSCPGGCQYCYLATTLGRKPYVRVYVNVNEILESVKKYIEKNLPHTTTFEAASTSDPLAVEHITGSLRQAIEFFGRQEHGRMRVVSKFAAVDGLLGADHRGHTRFRFSINTDFIVKSYEANTAGFKERLEAAGKMATAGYPLGFIIAPLFIYEGWRKDYRHLLELLSEELGAVARTQKVSFELISHRFTARAKKIILERFPRTTLEMDESKRRFKWGKYGYGKYMYPPDKLDDLKVYMTNEINRVFPRAKIEYFT